MASIFPNRTSILALDLTAAGAPALLQRERDPETESFIQARLAGLAKLLDEAGADLITLGQEFRLGGKRRRDDFLDGALALSRLGGHTSRVRLATSIPLAQAEPNAITGAIGSVHKATTRRAAWQVDVPTPEPAHAVDVVTSGLKTLPGKTGVVINVSSDVDVEIAAARAHVARLRVNTVEEARTLRAAIRSAAEDWGRNPDEISVLVDVHTILAETLEDAESRALFIEDLGGEHTQGLLHHVGTVTTLASVWQNWVRAGAADGFVILPASIPTDVIHVASGLIPELQRRGLRTALDSSPTPSYARRVQKQRVSV